MILCNHEGCMRCCISWCLGLYATEFTKNIQFYQLKKLSQKNESSNTLKTKIISYSVNCTKGFAADLNLGSKTLPWLLTVPSYLFYSSHEHSTLIAWTCSNILASVFSILTPFPQLSALQVCGHITLVSWISYLIYICSLRKMLFLIRAPRRCRRRPKSSHCSRIVILEDRGPTLKWVLK